jgi:hypothetical protein
VKSSRCWAAGHHIFFKTFIKSIFVIKTKKLTIFNNLKSLI